LNPGLQFSLLVFVVDALPKGVSDARCVPLFVFALCIPLRDQDEKIAGAASFADDLLSSQNSMQLVWVTSEKRAKTCHAGAMDFRWKTLAGLAQSCKVEFKWYFSVE